MRELALFAGVGCGMLGTSMLGVKPWIVVEKDEFKNSVLRQRLIEGLFEPFTLLSDIKDHSFTSYRGMIDLVSGGFPCQAFSKAARGRNTAENLWPEMARVISEVEPRYVFAENVSRKAIEQAANDCASMGYKAELLSLSAADLGADHKRERFWLLAYADNKSQLLSTIHDAMGKLPEFCGSVWESEPRESGVVNGIAGRMDRFKATGDGQLPVVAAAALITLAAA